MLQKDDNNGYLKNKWHQLQVMMSGTTFRFYLSEIDGAVTQLFGEEDQKDDSINEGTLGLTTFLTKAGFDEIRMYP